MKDNIIGVRIKLLRTERDLTMQMLADDLCRLYGVKITKGMISKWEAGEDMISVQSLRIIIQYFDESADFMLGLTNDRKHPHHLLA